MAEVLSGDLVTVNDVDENTWLFDNFGQYTNFYIGFTDQVVEDTFEWISGQTPTYTNWNAGEPNDAGAGEDYTEFLGSSLWNDGSRNTARRSVVEVEDCGVAAPTDLMCEVAGADILVSFTNNGPYAGGIEVLRNGFPYDTITDPDATSYTDPSPAAGSYRYILRPGDGAGCVNYSEQCSVLFVPAGTTDLVYSPSETGPGATDDVTFLTASLAANDIDTFAVSDSLPDDLSGFDRVWALLGTYPINHVLSQDEGLTLQDYAFASGRLYISGGDIWGFDPQTPIDVVDGIASGPTLDGPQACDLFSVNGLDSGQGLDLTPFFGVGTVQNGGECAWIDQLVVDDAGPVWQNADTNNICGTYHDGDVSGTSAPGDYRIICTSFEFATLGTSQSDLDDVMAEYLAAFEGILPMDEFIRGDADGSGAFNALVDGIFILNFGFVPGSDEPPCLAAADCDGNDAFNALVDGIYVLNFGFVPGAPPIPPPYPDCGEDEDTTNALGCDDTSACP